MEDGPEVPEAPVRTGGTGGAGRGPVQYKERIATPQGVKGELTP